MYAIFQNCGKQHRVSEGQIIYLEKLNIVAGGTIEFTDVLMIVNNEKVEIGVPFIKGSVIKANVLTHERSKKIKIIKFRRRKHYRKQKNHRQWFTKLKITNINSPDICTKDQ